MTEYTDEADKAISESPRTVQAGDVVFHEDAPYVIFGNVYAIENGTASVEWPGTDVQDGIPVDRLRFVSRPDAYVCVSYHGTDELDGTEKSYRLVHNSDDVGLIASDVAFYGRAEGYTVVDSCVPTVQEDAAGEDDGAP